MSHYIIYCRKSSESEERQVLSIESQIKEIKEFAKRMDLSISEILTESQSAKYPGRPIFNTMMREVYKEKVKGIVCWKLDRLARNPLDGSALVWALDQGHISEIITPHGTFKNSSNDKFLMQLEFGMAKKYVDDLSDNVKRGNRAKLERGWVPGHAPLGYLNEPRERTIVKDPARLHLVRKMWDLLLQGVVPSEILRAANEEWGFRTRISKKLGGKPLCSSALYKIFKSPFYYGLIVRREGVFQGKHETIITEEEYWKAQEILGRKGNARPKEHHFAFTGMIRCGECGGMITAEDKTNRYGYHYTYYRCTKKKRNTPCGQRYISVLSLEKQIMERLKSIYVPDRLLDLAIKHLQAESKEENERLKDIERSLEKAYDDCQKKLTNLNQMRLRDLIGDDEYVSEKQKLLGEKIRLEEKLKEGNHNESRVTELTEKALIFTRHALDCFHNGTLEDKKTILREIGSNFSLRDKKLFIQAEKPFLIIEKGLKKLNDEIRPLELQEIGSVKGRNGLPVAMIPSWCATVEDVRTFYREHPDFKSPLSGNAPIITQDEVAVKI